MRLRTALTVLALTLVACGRGTPVATTTFSPAVQASSTIPGGGAATTGRSPNNGSVGTTPSGTTDDGKGVPINTNRPPGSEIPPWQAVGVPVDQLGQRSPEGYAGYTLDVAGQALDIYVVKDFNALAASLQAVAAPYGRVTFVDRSYALLVATADSVNASSGWFKGIGLELTNALPAVRTNSVSVGVFSSFTPVQEQAVKAHFGQYVELHQAVLDPTAVPTPFLPPT